MSLLSRSLAVRIVAFCAIGAVVALGPAATGSAAAPTTTADPAAAAAGWLVQQFSNAHNQRVPSGDHIELSFDAGSGPQFYFDGGGTADAAFALAATHSGRAKIDTATGYVAAHLDEYVDYSKAQGGPFYGSIGKAALLAIVDGRDPNNFGGHHLLDELRSDECPSGSSTCTPGNNSNVFSTVSTSFIVMAEKRGHAGPSANLVNFLLSEQCPDGGFSSDIPAATPCASDVDATGYAVMALQALGGHDQQIAQAADFLATTRGSDGAWSENGGANIDSTGLGAAALSIAGRGSSASRTWLADQQVTVGPTIGTGSQRGALKYQGAYDPNASIKGTSDGIFGLVPGFSLATASVDGATPGTRVLALAAPSLGHARVRPGGSQTVTGTGFSAGEKVQVSVHSAPLAVGQTTANTNGTAALTFTVPTTLAPGPHTVVLAGASSGLASQARFTVSATASGPTPAPAPAQPTSPGTAPILADTGRDAEQTGNAVLLGLGCLVLGTAALVLGRRRGSGS